VKIGELLKVARAVVQNVVEVPDLEAVAHADEQDVACLAAPLVEPGRDRQPTFAIDAGRGGETEVAAQPVERVGRVGQAADHAVAREALDPFVEQDAVEYDQAIEMVVQANVHLVARAARRHDAEKWLRQHDDATAASLADCTPYKQAIHVRSPRLLSQV